MWADPLARSAGLVGVGLLWLSVAWISPMPLVLLAALAAGVYLYRRRHPASASADDDLDTL
jgi:hypothetical protein